MAEQHKTKDDLHQIYILPALERFKQKDINLLFLPDGNDRAKKFHKLGYGEGGKNVVRQINSLSERADIGKVVFALMSHENILRRDDRFFNEMYLAFLGLGVAIEGQGELVSKGVRLELCGSLALLREKSPVGARLAEMIEAVVGLTKEAVKEPKMVVELGFDYDKMTLLEKQIDIVFRSGMQESERFRSSGLLVGPRTVCYAFEELWPVVTPERVNDAIDEVKNRPRDFFEDGYDLSLIADFGKEIGDRKAEITIPMTTEVRVARRMLEKIMRDSRVRLENWAVSIYDQGGQEACRIRNGREERELKLVRCSGLEDYLRKETPFYSAMIAPGQRTQDFILPTKPEIGYATIFGAGKTPGEIFETVRQSIDNLKDSPPLIGGSREMLAVVESVKVLTEALSLPEFKRYYNLQHFLDINPDLDLEGAAAVINKREKKPDGLEKYNLMSDLFVAKMLGWARSHEIHFTTTEELTAFVNYAHTSFFLTYYPSHPQWDKLSKGWERRAECLAEYMEIVYTLDDRIFDLKLPDDQKKRELEFATEHLTGAILNEKIKFKDDGLVTGPVVKKLVAAIETLRDKLESDGQTEYFQQWQDVFVNLVQCHKQEFAQSVDGVGPVDLLARGSITLAKFAERYELEKKPEFIRDLVNEVRGAVGNNRVTEVGHLADMELFTYLCDIENSIGSALVYRTLACINSDKVRPQKMSKEQQEIYEEICYLINIYFRLANDFAELYRNENDKEDGHDAVEIISKKYARHSKEVKLIKVATEMQKLLKNARAQINAKRAKFLELSTETPWAQIALAIFRSDIGELFYKGTHYRNADRNKVEKFYEQLQWSGIK